MIQKCNSWEVAATTRTYSDYSTKTLYVWQLIRHFSVGLSTAEVGSSDQQAQSGQGCLRWLLGQSARICKAKLQRFFWTTSCWIQLSNGSQWDRATSVRHKLMKDLKEKPHLKQEPVRLGFSLTNHPLWGTPIDGTSMLKSHSSQRSFCRRPARRWKRRWPGPCQNRGHGEKLDKTTWMSSNHKYHKCHKYHKYHEYHEYHRYHRYH